MMLEPIQHCGGRLGVAEHAAQLGKRQIGRDHHAGVLVELQEQMEQQRAARLAEGQIHQLVNNHQIDIEKPQRDLARGALASAGQLTREPQLRTSVENFDDFCIDRSAQDLDLPQNPEPFTQANAESHAP
jgi:hypothetical protein